MDLVLTNLFKCVIMIQIFSKSKSGWYIYGSGDAGWMGVIDGPYISEDAAMNTATQWTNPSWYKNELQIRYSEKGESI
jgi:hypothetical protein